MKLLPVSISDCQVSRDREAALITYALGSCIALMIYDPVSGVAGLLHFMLPEAGNDHQRARANPFAFASTGIPLLFRKAYELGALKPRIIATATGGAHVLSTNAAFNIGQQNYIALREILRRAGVPLHHEEVGGTTPRNARIRVSDGGVTIWQGRQEHELTPPSFAEKRRHGNAS